MHIPPPNDFNKLDVPEACLVILKTLVSDDRHAGKSSRPGWPNGVQPLLERNFQMGTVLAGYEGANEMQQQLSAAWLFANNKGYLYSNEEGVSRISEDGIEYAKTEIRFQEVDQLRQLHPNVQAKVEGKFRVGKNSDAIALAFNEIESTAKEKAWPTQSPPTQQWIEKAFDPGNAKSGVQPGPLVNKSYNPTEQKSTRNLFLGAFGLYRNRNTHQNPYIPEGEALSVLGLCSLLMEELDKVP